MTTYLSEHFSLEEMSASEVAARKNLDNTPTGQILEHLKHTASQMELVRAALGNRSIHVNSAYRSIPVNAAVGGVSTSAHCLGHAVDFICPSFGTPYDVSKALAHAGVHFDQIIHEYGTWTHISFDPRLRGQLLTIGGKYHSYQSGILPIW